MAAIKPRVKAKSGVKEKYGLYWEEHQDDLDIEMSCIVHGKGKGAFYHYKEVQKLLWPEEDHHRWSDLILQQILNNRITAIIGPKDSGKTRGMSKFALTDYFCFPDETLILISSTDLRGLELRVWGDLKSLFQRAKDRYPHLPGHLIDSKHAIATQNIKEDEVRDMRKGVVCFPTGTLVDTPQGKCLIEDLEIGDEVINAQGIGTVRGFQTTIAEQLVRVRLSDGRSIDCTPEHPFFTRRGWVNAVDLRTCDTVFSAHETMCILWSSTWSRLSQSQALFGDVSKFFTAQAMRALWKNVSSTQAKAKQSEYGSILQQEMCELLGSVSRSDLSENHKTMPTVRQKDEECTFQEGILLRALPELAKTGQLSGMRKEFHVYPAFENEAADSVLQHILQVEICQSHKWRKTFVGNGIRKENQDVVSNVYSSLQSFHGQNYRERRETLLRIGCGISVIEAGRGNRWRSSSDAIQKAEGHRENQSVKYTWVDSVEVLESGSDPRFDESAGGYQVHNLAVDGHPSYSVNGVIVHNCIPCMSAGGSWIGLGKYVGIKQKRRRLLSDECQFMRPSFLESLANLNSGDFKGVFVGNPIGENDPLDKISEPKEGWGTEGEISKTSVWEGRFPESKTVNLIGTDSPNFEFSQENGPRYPYLINQKSIDDVVSFYGKDSLQYNSQCLGRRRLGLHSRRVLTKPLCRKFHAFEPVVWRDQYHTKVYAVDAAYGGTGGDRCIGGSIEYGMDINNRILLLVNEPTIIPVSVAVDKLPEDQIAEYVKMDCERLGIPANHVFYDATGRGSLGTSFARIWSAYVNPVEFGGRPTTRPVSGNMMIFDEAEKRQRFKQCDEHYSKFVTELWWSVRLVIESDQMRGLPEHVADEGCAREWKLVKGDKIEIESKVDMKERVGYSPDKFDWLVTCVEGARRLGFVINKLANQEVREQDDSWKMQMRNRARQLRRAHSLDYAA